MKTKNFKIIYLILILIIFSSITFAEKSYKKAEVVQEMSRKQIVDQPGFKIIRQNLLIKLNDSKNVAGLTNDYNPEHPEEIILEPGDNIIVNFNKDKNEYLFFSYDRTNYLLITLLIFFLLVILIGKKKGVKALISLIATIILLFLIYIPFILKGVSIIALTILVSILAILITVIVLNGFSIKSISSIFGIITGLIASGILSYIMIEVTNLTGISLNSSQMLKYLPQNIDIDFGGLLLSSVIIGALGAVMDVGVEISSSMYEIKMANKDMKMKEHVKRGFNVGKDVIGTMTNTLVLAYTGASLPILIIFVAYKWEFIKIINLDIISSEILRALAGSVGLVLAIPATIFISAFLLHEKYNN